MGIRVTRVRLAIAAALLCACSAVAQQAAPAPLPYETDMLRLAEIMGGLHYLQQLCAGEGSSTWRDQMNALTNAEQPDAERRLRMADSFNRGYESYRAVYRSCTNAARETIVRYQDEGFRLAGEIEERYGTADDGK